MNMLQIERILKNDPYAKKILKVICCLLLTVLEVMPSTLILTPLLESTELLCSLTMKDLLSFFDSFSLHPIVQQFFGLVFLIIDLQFKDLTEFDISNLWLLYCILHVISFVQLLSPSEILNRFSNNVALNDRTVQRFVENLLK